MKARERSERADRDLTGAVGVLIVAAHVAGFVAYAPDLRGTDLAVEVKSPLAWPVVALDGEVPPGIAARVKTRFEVEPGPGLVRKTWSVDYRGGFQRSVGATQLVGPFQDPDSRDCVGRIVVGQKLLDDGNAGPGTIAAEMRKQIVAEMQGISIFGLGNFTGLDRFAIQWATLDKHPQDLKLVGQYAPYGYVRVATRLVFDRVKVPLFIALILKPSADALDFSVVAQAELDFGNRVLNWTNDKIGGDKLATKLANREIDAALLTTLAPPPPFDLPDGQQLVFGYCAGDPEIVDGESGSLPFSVAIGRVPGEPFVRPPKRGPAPRKPFDKSAALAVDLDLDALNALLYELWRTGFLDRRLREAGLDRRFNEDPTVTEFLTLRISPLRLVLPPVLRPHSTGLRMAAEARVDVLDGEAQTVGRVWGGLDFQFGQQVSVDLGVLELSCEKSPTLLVPCFADLVGAMRERGPDFHGELTSVLSSLITDIFVERRLGIEGLPSDLVIQSAKPSVSVSASNASLHFDIAARLEPAQ